ncbi:MAG: glycosyltransferase [Candidatus Omnitrophica bacterium]|nr:glycosyltransferase [Candidatus Omnitrophota bacterium]
MRILFACERSAGHIFPALSIAKKIKIAQRDSESEKKEEIYFFVSSKDLKKYVEAEGFVVFGKYFSFRCLAIEGFFRFIEAIYIISKLRPERVIGFGGRDSFFLILLSSLLSIDTVLYEPNVSLGKANKVLSRFVKKILRGFPSQESSQKNLVFGVPLRDNLKRLDKQKAREILQFDAKTVILCCGGSQGSRFINQNFVRFVQQFKGDCQIIHLTGKDKFLEIRENYNKIECKSFVEDFYYNLEVLYSAADLVVSRAGALTLSEISYYRLAALLIPHTGASGHQRENALYFQQRDAALLCSEDNFSFSDFSKSLSSLIYDDNLRERLALNAAKIELGVDFESLDINYWR